MHRKIPSLLAGKRSLIFVLLLGCVEFGLVAGFSLGIEPDPKNALLFGYSLSRLALSGLALICSGGLLWIALSAAYRARVIHRLEALWQKAPLAAGWIVILLTGLAVVIGLTPFEILKELGLYFLRVRLFLMAVCLYPAQFYCAWLLVRTKRPDPIKPMWTALWSLLVGIASAPENKYGGWQRLRVGMAELRPFLLSLGILFALGGFIVLTGLGITPDGEYWNPAGSPLTSLQLSILVWLGVLVLGLFGLSKAKLPGQIGGVLDTLIILGLLSGAMILWLKVPSPHNEFSSRPAAPYFQSYPASDAAVHDLGGLSILKGSGIYFGGYTDKPLYMVFLALLHLAGGFDYNFLTVLHASFMALMLPGLYLLGKSFHSRLFGFILASSILVRQANAVSLSNLLYFNATPRQFLTEVPTLVGLIFFSWALFLWLRARESGGWRAFLAGGILGAVVLIRLNPFLLIPAVPLFLFFSSARRKKAWLAQSLAFLLGCTVVLAPWVVSGKDAAGTPYLLVKFYDIINVRYGPSGALPSENNFGFWPSPASALAGQAVDLAPLSSGFDLPPISTQTFPGFIINHTLHNFVGAFLSLPDSIQIADQNLAVLTSRPTWTAGLDTVSIQQAPFLLLNLVFLAGGLGWSWKRWKWAGLAPVFVFAAYALSLGFGRTSGSRYLVPIDWVVNFYFGLGLLGLFQFLPGSLQRMLGIEDKLTRTTNPGPSRTPAWVRFGAVGLVFGLAAFVPVAQAMIPAQAPFCQPGNLDKLAANLVEQGAPGQLNLVYGQVLYPEVKKDRLSFVLLTCHQFASFEIEGFHGQLAVGEQVIAGLSDNSPNPRLVVLALPPGEKANAQLIWP